MKSKVKFEGINYDIAKRFLAVIIIQERLAKVGLLKLMPRRKVNSQKGRKLTV